MPEDMLPLKSAKSKLRKAIQTSLKRLSEAEVMEQSSKIHEQLLSMPEYGSARNIGIYLSMPGAEVQTRPLVYDALRRGKTVFVPFLYKTSSASSRSLMDMVALHSEDDYRSLKPDRWGIPSIDPSSVTNRARCLCSRFDIEATDETSSRKTEPLDMIVVPGVAFDTTRHRLGHGKGYYDIFLSQYHEFKGSDEEEVKMPYLVGLALDQQILPEGESIPVDTSDWSLDALLGGTTTVK